MDCGQPFRRLSNAGVSALLKRDTLATDSCEKVAPVYQVAQALDNAFVQEQGRVMEAPHPARGTIRTLASPIRCPGELEKVGIAPALGEHTRELLRGLGYDDARIDELAKSGAL